MDELRCEGCGHLIEDSLLKIIEKQAGEKGIDPSEVGVNHCHKCPPEISEQADVVSHRAAALWCRGCGAQVAEDIAARMVDDCLSSGGTIESLNINRCPECAGAPWEQDGEAWKG